MQRVVGKRGIHGDIAVIADEQVSPGSIQMFEAGDGKARRRVLDHAIHIAFYKLLQILNAVHVSQLPRQVTAYQGF